jgi:hypothetical protein
MKAYFERVNRFDRADAHLYEVIYTRGRLDAAVGNRAVNKVSEKDIKAIEAPAE